MQKLSQKDYWDSVSEKKEFTTVLDINLVQPFINTDSFIVDYGCGYGRTLDQLWQKGFQNTLGFDFSPEMIQRGKKEFPYLNLKTSRNNGIDCADGSVDMVILFAVLTCIIQDREQEKLMKEILRVLKPDGIIYINDFLVNNDERNKNRYQAFKDKYNIYGVFELPEGALLRHYEQNRINQLTRQFEEIAFKKTTFKTMNGHQSNGFIYVGRK